MQDKQTQEINDELEGTSRKILVESKSKKFENNFMGRTRSWNIVHFNGEPDLVGKWCR